MTGPQTPGFIDLTRTENIGDIVARLGEFASAEVFISKEVATLVVRQISQALDAGMQTYREAVARSHAVEDRNFQLYIRSGRLLRFMSFNLRLRRQVEKATQQAFADSRRFVEAAMTDSGSLFRESVQATMSTLDSLHVSKTRAKTLLTSIVTRYLPDDVARTIVGSLNTIIDAPAV